MQRYKHELLYMLNMKYEMYGFVCSVTLVCVCVCVCARARARVCIDVLVGPFHIPPPDNLLGCREQVRFGTFFF